jgi:hypothetical protein
MGGPAPRGYPHARGVAVSNSLGLASTVIVAAIVITALASWGGRVYRWLCAVITRTVDEHAARCRREGQE